MIFCQTELPDIAFGELADLIRLFFPLEAVEAGEGDPLLTHHVEEIPGGWRHVSRWKRDGRQAVGEMTMPYPAQRDRVQDVRMLRRGAKLSAYRAMKALEGSHFLWGSLTGIRPTKLLRHLAAEEGSEEAGAKALESVFDVAPDRVTLLRDIFREQEGIYRWGDEEALDVYIGIPFCRTRCLYCSFISVDMAKTRCDVAGYVDALCHEIRYGGQLAREMGRKIRAVYVGGGTPSAIGTELLRKVLTEALAAFPDAREFTVEAGRPDTLGGDMLPMLRALGIGRISINPQTMNDETLAAIGRDHTAAQTLEALDRAVRLGFPHINMDLIMGLPGETLAHVERTLSRVRPLPIDNLTVHTLTIKRSSALHEHLARYPLPDTDAVEAMVRAGADHARAMGMVPYYLYRQKNQRANLENVGYTRPGAACIYNVDIMEETHDILALGAGAISKHMLFAENRHIRLPHPKSVPHYVAQLRENEEKLRAFFLEGEPEDRKEDGRNGPEKEEPCS